MEMDTGSKRETSRKSYCGEEQHTDDGCFNMTKLAGQVLARGGMGSARLPRLLSKRFRTNSLPRQLPRPINDPPTPAATPETEYHLKVQGSNLFSRIGKRCASVSPNRGDRKRMYFSRLSRETLPEPIRRLLRCSSRSKVQVITVPLKPSRRRGPLGKTWVKVFDDIIYMDASLDDELFPVLGYNGYPNFIPDAEPLPIAPTPPPERVISDNKYLDMSTEGELIVPKRNKKIERRNKEALENIVNYASYANIQENDKPNAVTRPGRSREPNRYKQKRHKRSATPVGADTLLSQCEEDGATYEINNEDKKEIETEKIPPEEDDYIIPSTIRTSKPLRVNKIHETINIVDSEKLNSNKELELHQTVVKTAEKPSKPKRGVKIYESIVISEKDGDHISPPNTKKYFIKMVKEKPNEENPNKPKRGIKIYETIHIGFRVDTDKEQKLKLKEKESEIDSKEDIVPQKPSRGNKIYANVKLETLGDFKMGSSSQDVIDNHNAKIEKEMTVKDNLPLYSTINTQFAESETLKSKDRMEGVENDYKKPPLIPPKKRKNKTDDEFVYEIMPPRPARNLKLKLPSNNDDLNLKGINNVPYESIRTSDVLQECEPATLPRSRSKKTNKEFTSDKITSQNIYNKHFQSRLLPAPPRRKRIERITNGSNEVNSYISIETQNADLNDVKTEASANNNNEITDISPENKLNQVMQFSPPKQDFKENEIIENEGRSTPSSEEENITNLSRIVSAVSEDDDKGTTVQSLDSDIDKNIKQIENSFETLVVVIKSLKKYTSQTKLNIVRSEEADVTLNSLSKDKIQNIDDTVTQQSDRNSEISLESEVCDISLSISDPDTVISIDKEESSLISNNLENNLAIKYDNNSNASCENTNNLDNVIKPIEVSFVIKSDEPLKLPNLCDYEKVSESNKIPLEQSEFKLLDQPEKECIVTTDIPLKLSTTEISTLELSSPEIENQRLNSTDIPLQLSTTETSEFHFLPASSDKAEQFESVSETISEFSLQFSTKGPGKVALDKKELEQLQEQISSATELPINLLETEIKDIINTQLTLTNYDETKESELKSNGRTSSEDQNTNEVHEPEEGEDNLGGPECIQKCESRNKKVFETEIPVKLNTIETSVFRFKQLKENLDSENILISTEIPIKCLTSEVSELKYKQADINAKSEDDASIKADDCNKAELGTSIETETKIQIDKVNKEALKNISIRAPSIKSSIFEFKQPGKFNESTVVSTEIPLKLTYSEISEFKLDTAEKIKAQCSNEQTTIIQNSALEKSQPSCDHMKAESVSDQTPELSELASRLEGIKSQLDQIITNYPASNSDISNRTSLSCDLNDSSVSFSSFDCPRSTSAHPSHSLCSTPQTFYTATSPSTTPLPTDSDASTPVLSPSPSFNANDDEIDFSHSAKETNDGHDHMM